MPNLTFLLAVDLASLAGPALEPQLGTQRVFGSSGVSSRSLAAPSSVALSVNSA